MKKNFNKVKYKIKIYFILKRANYEVARGKLPMFPFTCNYMVEFKSSARDFGSNYAATNF